MPQELDIHSLPDSHRRYGDFLKLTKDCSGCQFSRTVVNRDWAPGHGPIGKVCLWGKNWKWLETPIENPKVCAKLSRPLPVESASRIASEEDYEPCGVAGDQFTLPLFSKIVGLYTDIVGGMALTEGEVEFYYNYAADDLKKTNAVGLRFGSHLSGDSKLIVEWRYLSRGSSNQALFFSCYPQAAHWDNQGEYLGSRFELAVNQYLRDEKIAIPLIE